MNTDAYTALERAMKSLDRASAIAGELARPRDDRWITRLLLVGGIFALIGVGTSVYAIVLILSR